MFSSDDESQPRNNRQAVAQNSQSGLSSHWPRWFALIFMCVIVLDAIPRSWVPGQQARRTLSQALGKVGLSQGEWSLFAPNPDVNNGWLSAEIVTTDNRQLTWMSPIWDDANAWDKFVRFRHMNFFNRLADAANLVAWDDLANWLARNHTGAISTEAYAVEKVREVSLYRNSMKMLRPEDGSLPSRDETTWITSNEFLTKRSFQP